ncbi:hypothetical protein NA57DRAFT_78110 [Rhizodiscina lignyota]|uniref:Heterokaryon incompatibility domain-containing protein n=1 Tax=Rhizodiscina lignyota TaxID=1504668 RepID=A0A9P4M6N3_9PEZI|nr:hypothetical protein NA57DRAFT_78110 [Rhizodiscina lignyota]
MHKIFGGAKFTIVAMSGSNADPGLAGISRPRNGQVSAYVQGRMIANGLNEGIFNNGSFILDEDGPNIIRHCIQDDEFLAPAKDTEQSATVLIRNFGHWGKPDIRLYFVFVRFYSRRKMLIFRDVFVACRGVISAFEAVFETFERIRDNIPLVYLDMALLWLPEGTLVRRHESGELSPAIAGSWNWSGWIGGVSYPKDAFTERIVPCVTWYEGPTTTSRQLPGNVFSQVERDAPLPPGWHQRKNEPPLIPYQNILTHYAKENAPERHYNRLMPSQDELMRLDGWLSNRAPSGDFTYLYLGTCVATLAVSRQHAQRSLFQGECSHSVCKLRIVDGNGVYIGVVTIDGNLAKEWSPGDYDFVKLSKMPTDELWLDTLNQRLTVSERIEPRGRGYEWFDSDVYESRLSDCEIDWPLYNVMMVKWDGDVATRLGIGRCHVRAFDAVASEFRRFRLG